MEPRILVSLLRSYGISFAILSLALFGCTGTSSTSVPDWEIVDSAGIKLVTSNLPLDHRQEGWAVAENPSLEIATHPMDPDQVIHWVRGVVRLPDDRITSISESSNDLRFFSESGELIQVVGREGDGPGEFRAPFQLTRLPGDTLVVTERGGDRRSWFTPQGEFLDRVTPDRVKGQSLAPSGFFLGFGFFVPPDGVLWELEKSGLGPVGTLFRQPRGYLLSPGPKTEPVLLGWYKGLEHFFVDRGVGRFAFFADNTYAAAGGDPTRIYIGDSEAFEIHAFDSDGTLVQIIRDTQPPPAIESRDIEWERWELLDWGKTTGMLEDFTHLGDAMPIPEERPAFEGMIVDSRGYLWVKEYSSYKPEAIRYRIYSPEGRGVGVIRLPGRLLVFDIGDDYVLGRYGDLDYVETIQMFDLTRPGKEPETSGLCIRVMRPCNQILRRELPAFCARALRYMSLATGHWSGGLRIDARPPFAMGNPV